MATYTRKKITTDGTPANVPSSLTSDWLDVVTAVDAAGFTTYLPVDADLPQSDSIVFERTNQTGTYVRVRMKYDDAHTGIDVQLTYTLYGRKKSDGADETDASRWQALPNLNGDKVVTLTASTGNDTAYDVTTSGVSNKWKATTPDRLLHSHDCDGCDEFFVNIVTPLEVPDGDISLNTIQAKII